MRNAQTDAPDAWIREGPEGAVLLVRVVPRADRNAIQGVQAGALRVRLQAPPVDNRANELLLRVLADALDLPRSAVRLLAGEKGRTKRLLARGLSAATARQKLGIPTGARP